MKRILIIAALTFIAGANISAPQYDFNANRGDIVDTWMLTSFPDWWKMKEITREAFRREFLASNEKDWWFPDVFETNKIK